MMTIDDCLAGTVKKEDLQLGWCVSLERGWLNLSYTIRDFDWKSVQDASDDKVNKFLTSDIYVKMKKMLDDARSKRKSLFYQACSIAEMKQMLENDDVKVDLDKLVRSKARSMAIPKHLKESS